jgi:hypothetical protein
MNEMDPLTIDVGPEMFEAVQARFFRTPVVTIAPEFDQLAQVVHGDAVVPTGVRNLIRKSGLDQAAMKVLQDRIIHPDLKCFDRFAQCDLTGSLSVERSRRHAPR